MTSNWLPYLAAATGCQLVFALLYGLALAPLRTFGWNRGYLLSALLLSVLLPLVALPSAWARWLWPAVPMVGLGAGWHPALGVAATPEAAAASAFRWEWLVLIGYWLGVAWRVARTARTLGWLYRLRRQHPRTQLGGGWLVQLPAPGRPAFSFGNHIFLSPQHAQLGAADYAQLLRHEQAHGRQLHSLDVLVAEALGWFFWFNGVVDYLGRQLRTVHEYLADAAAAPPAPGPRRAYGHLLLKLAAAPPPGTVAHAFATQQVARRLHMLTSPPTSSMKKLRFLLVMPVVVAAWLGTAALGPRPVLGAAPAAHRPYSAALGRIGTIAWQGNTYLSNEELDAALGLKPGDPYDPALVEEKLGAWTDSRSITSRYMDNGYLFFQITPTAKTRPDGTTDLTFRLSEGPTVRLGEVRVQGNHRVPTATVLQLTELHSGELFSRAKLMAAQRNLATSGFFVPTAVNINPQPIPDKALVNIEFALTEK